MKYKRQEEGANLVSPLKFLSSDACHSACPRIRPTLTAGNARGRSMARYLISLTAMMLLLSACASNSYQNIGSDPDVQKTWNNAFVSTPGGVSGSMNLPKVQEALKANLGRPVVLFFHGCNGFTYNGGMSKLVTDFARSLNEAGYIVVAPDSFARTVRTSSCPGGSFSYSAKGVDWDTINRMRMEEIYFSISQTEHSSWVGKDIFLFGQSEGGLAVASYQGTDVSGIVVSGWGCPTRTLANRDSTLIERPVKAPPSVPVLNIKSKMDPVDTRPNDCGSSVWGRPGGSKVINPPVGHWVMDNAEYRQEVIVFFDRNRHSDSAEPAKESNK